MWKIHAPVKNINGIYASVMFVNSVGETNNPALVEWFKKHGYRVEHDCIKMESDPIDTPNNDSEFVEINKLADESTDPTEPDFDAMTPNELRDWMKENGLGDKIRNTRNKEKLLQIIRG